MPFVSKTHHAFSGKKEFRIVPSFRNADDEITLVLSHLNVTLLSVCRF